MRNFEKWLGKFKNSIATYDYYIDLKKVIKNVDNIKIELNILNSLIGSKNIEKDFENIIKKYPETLKCIPILLAIRDTEIYAQDAFEKVGFKLKEIIIKEQHNCKATGYWKTNSIKYNFFLIAHEYLFIFKK